MYSFGKEAHSFMSLLTQRPPPTQPAKVDQTTFLVRSVSYPTVIYDVLKTCQGVIWAGVAVSLVFLLIRLFARWKGFKKLFVDDAFVIFAWLLALLTAVDWQVVARWMYQFIAVTSGQQWPPPISFVKDSERYYKGSVVVLVFFYTSLWAVKISFLLFFRRLSQNVAGQKVLWWCIFAFTLASYFVCVGDIQFSCLAAPLEDIFAHCSSDAAVHFQQSTLKFNCAIDVLTDFASKSCHLENVFGRSISDWRNSHGDSHQHAMEGSDVVQQKGGAGWYLLTSCHHLCLCHRPGYRD